jgi:hypothetical protein
LCKKKLFEFIATIRDISHQGDGVMIIFELARIDLAQLSNLFFIDSPTDAGPFIYPIQFPPPPPREAPNRTWHIQEETNWQLDDE